MKKLLSVLLALFVAMKICVIYKFANELIQKVNDLIKTNRKKYDILYAEVRS